MKKLRFLADGMVVVIPRESPQTKLERLYALAHSMDYSAITTLCILKQERIDEEDYEALIPFRDLEEKYNVCIPFIIRED